MMIMMSHIASVIYRYTGVGILSSTAVVYNTRQDTLNLMIETTSVRTALAILAILNLSVKSKTLTTKLNN